MEYLRGGGRAELELRTRLDRGVRTGRMVRETWEAASWGAESVQQGAMRARPC